MSGGDFFFHIPNGWWLILLFIPLVYGMWTLSRYRRQHLHAYAPFSTLTHLLVPRATGFTRAKSIGWACIWGLACLAFMGPFGNIRYPPLANSAPPNQALGRYVPHEVIFLVDTSASMRVPDGPEKETRLNETKAIVEDVIRQMRGQTLSLYAFTSELTPVVPPTLDYLFVRLSLKDLHIDEGGIGGTRFSTILKELKEKAFPQPSLKQYTVILFSDGGDTELDQLSGAAKEKEREAILNAIPNPEELHLRLFTVGLGSLTAHPIPHVSYEGKPVFSKLEPEILQQLAAKERGKFFMAQEWTYWNLSQEISAEIGEDQLVDETTGVERQVASVKSEDILSDLYFQIPLGVALLLYFFNLLLPDVRRS